MKDISLHRPGSESVGLDFLLYRNGYVLMPGNFPVGIRNLVEKNSSYGKEPGSKN
jgi:hypothetical protein